eukprot:3759820-Rhodomonas_salina.1
MLNANLAGARFWKFAQHPAITETGVAAPPQENNPITACTVLSGHRIPHWERTFGLGGTALKVSAFSLHCAGQFKCGVHS